MDTTTETPVEQYPEGKNPLLKVFSYILSGLFHPLVITMYAFLFINILNPYQFIHLTKTGILQLGVTLATNTLVFPLVTVIIMSRLGFISSLEMKDRQERIIPYIGMSLFYFWTYLVVKQLGVGTYFTHVMLGISLSVFAAFFFNLFYKVSIHSIAMGGFVGIALSLTVISTYNLLTPLLLVIVFAGAVGSARMYLGSHNAVQVYSGYMIGLLAQLISFTFL